MKIEIVEVKEGYVYFEFKNILGTTLLREKSFIQEGTMSFNDILECAYARKYPERVQEDIQF